jgi:methionine-gamma-lyase
VRVVDRFEFDTRCVHAGESPDPTTGAHGTPMYQNVTYAFDSYEQVALMRVGERPHFTYSPRGNPTVRSLEVKIADLEGAETCLALNSGMAAISSAILGVVTDGGHIIASRHLYDNSRDLLEYELPHYGASATLVDLTDEAQIAAAITPNSRAIYAETFSNPHLHVLDIARLSKIARRHSLLLIVDNTFLSPALYRPIEHGADLVVHSATKYLSGHGQVQAGVISGSRPLIAPLRERAMLLGNHLSPFAAWVLLSGIHTLPLRISRHCENALALATLLSEHPAVASVNYPGLVDDPDHAAATHMLAASGPDFGGMISFTLRDENSAARFINSLELCTIAVSLGDCTTLVWPWHTEGLIRVSTGIEATRDLERDFANALQS